LRRWREQHKLDDSAAPERSFAVELAVAGAYAASGLHREALDAYTALVKNKAVPNSARWEGVGETWGGGRGTLGLCGGRMRGCKG
jgi:hypothetical protein